MEEFVSVVSLQRQKDSSFMVSVPARIVKRLNLKKFQELTVLCDGNRIIYEVKE